METRESRVTRKKPDKRLREQIGALVAAAAAGREDMAWLDQAIRKAGYVRWDERLTKDDAAEAVKAITAILEDVALDCRAQCGDDFAAKVRKGIERICGLDSPGSVPAPREPAAKA
jgi:hypothetical protein